MVYETQKSGVLQYEVEQSGWSWDGTGHGGAGWREMERYRGGQAEMRTRWNRNGLDREVG